MNPSLPMTDNLHVEEVFLCVSVSLEVPVAEPQPLLGSPAPNLTPTQL